MMDDPILAFVIALTLFIGVSFGFMWGNYESKAAITECQKELPRNVHCTIIAVPVDRN